MKHNERIVIAQAIDWHDQPTTERAVRHRIAARLQRELHAATTTDALNEARRIRRMAVEDGIHVRPERKRADPYFYRTDRPTASMPWRTSS